MTFTYDERDDPTDDEQPKTKYKIPLEDTDE